MFTTALIIRYSKIIILFSIGALGALVTFGNITDYDSNFQFVAHVLSMDSRMQGLGDSITYRAITSPFMHHLSYIFVIAFEGLLSILALAGSYKMFKARKDSAKDFHESKRLGIISLTLCCLLWFFGFQVVAGEWFAMWMSAQWNGLDSAFRLVTYMLLALIFISLKNDD